MIAPASGLPPKHENRKQHLTDNVVLYFIGCLLLMVGLATKVIILMTLGIASAFAAGGYVGMVIGRSKGQGGMGFALGALFGVFGWLVCGQAAAGLWLVNLPATC